jgi:hypothetical protein
VSPCEPRTATIARYPKGGGAWRRVCESLRSQQTVRQVSVSAESCGKPAHANIAGLAGFERFTCGLFRAEQERLHATPIGRPGPDRQTSAPQQVASIDQET